MRDPNKFTVAELKSLLTSRGLPSAGTKAELISRIMDADPSGAWMEGEQSSTSNENEDFQAGKTLDIQEAMSLQQREIDLCRKEKELVERELALTRRELEAVRREQRSAQSTTPSVEEEHSREGSIIGNVAANTGDVANVPIQADRPE